MEKCLAALSTSPSIEHLHELRQLIDHEPQSLANQINLLRCMELLSQLIPVFEIQALGVIARVFARRGREATLYLNYLFPMLAEVENASLELIEAFKAILRAILKPRRGKLGKARPFTSLAETVEMTIDAIQRRCLRMMNEKGPVLVETIWTLELIARNRPIEVFIGINGDESEDLLIAKLYLARHLPETLEVAHLLDRNPAIAAAAFKYLVAKQDLRVRQCLDARWLTEDLATEAGELLGVEMVLTLLRKRGFVAPLELFASQLGDLLEDTDIAPICQSEDALRICFRILCASALNTALADSIWQQIQSMDLENPFGSGCCVKLAEYNIEIPSSFGRQFLDSEDEIVQANGLALLASDKDLVRSTLQRTESDRVIWTAIHACRRYGWIDLIPDIIPAIKEVKPLKEFLSMLTEHWDRIDTQSLLTWRPDDDRLQGILTEFLNKMKIV